MAGLTMEELNQLVAAKLAEQQERAAAGAQVGQPGGCCGGSLGSRESCLCSLVPHGARAVRQGCPLGSLSCWLQRNQGTVFPGGTPLSFPPGLF